MHCTANRKIEKAQYIRGPHCHLKRIRRSYMRPSRFSTEYEKAAEIERLGDNSL